MITVAATSGFYDILKKWNLPQLCISTPSAGYLFDIAVIEYLPVFVSVPFSCHILITPPQLISSAITTDIVVTYGFGTKNTVTISSVESPVIAIQRKFKNISGLFVEEQEIKIPSLSYDPETAAALSALGLAAGADIGKLDVLLKQ